MRFVIAILLGLPAVVALGQPPAPAPIVCFDIAGSEGSALQQFYADLFGWTASATGEVSVPMVLIEMEDGAIKIP